MLSRTASSYEDEGTTLKIPFNAKHMKIVRAICNLLFYELTVLNGLPKAVVVDKVVVVDKASGAKKASLS
jgi:hypothetical protein